MHINITTKSDSKNKSCNFKGIIPGANDLCLISIKVLIATVHINIRLNVYVVRNYSRNKL